MTDSAWVRFDPVAALGAAAGIVVGLWTGIGVIVQALLILMIADIVTGTIAAAVESTVNSQMSRRGIAKKSTALILVMLVAWLSANLSGYLGEGFPGADAVAGAFILTEIISILENAKRTGVNLGPLEKVLALARGAQPAQQPGPPHG